MGVTVLLIRHGAIDALGIRIAGRSPGEHLNEVGRKQATCLAEHLKDAPMRKILTSPLERARETAQAIASRTGVEMVIETNANELDYGAWTGKQFVELNELPEWHAFNAQRARAVIPGGETMQQLCMRAQSVLDDVSQSADGDVVAIVSHADWIRAAFASQFQLSLDDVKHFEVSPASITVLLLANHQSKLLQWNIAAETKEPITLPS